MGAIKLDMYDQIKELKQIESGHVLKDIVTRLDVERELTQSEEMKKFLDKLADQLAKDVERTKRIVKEVYGEKKYNDSF
jgi:hypothetical protein